MAELILTPEEEALDSYLRFDDASLGRLMKAVARDLEEHIQESKGDSAAVQAGTVALMLMAYAYRARGQELRIVQDGVTLDDGETSIGNWEVLVRKRGNLEEGAKAETPGQRVVVTAEPKSWGHRLSMAMALIAGALRIVFLGGMQLEIRGDFKISSFGYNWQTLKAVGQDAQG